MIKQGLDYDTNVRASLFFAQDRDDGTSRKLLTNGLVALLAGGLCATMGS